MPNIEIQEAGESAIVLLLSYDTTRNAVHAVRSLYNQIRGSAIPGIASATPGLDSLLITFAPAADPEDIKHALLQLDPGEANMAQEARTIYVPVCYEPQFSLDMPFITEASGLSEDAIIQIHTSIEFETWMIGFMPGFPYLGELPKQLQFARKAVPSGLLPAGSVAIAEEYTGVYPFDSPGGWHVVGRTPRKVVDYTRPDPWLFEYAVKVKFYPITANQFYSTAKSRES